MSPLHCVCVAAWKQLCSKLSLLFMAACYRSDNVDLTSSRPHHRHLLVGFLETFFPFQNTIEHSIDDARYKLIFFKFLTYLVFMYKCVSDLDLTFSCVEIPGDSVDKFSRQSSSSSAAGNVITDQVVSFMRDVGQEIH